MRLHERELDVNRAETEFNVLVSHFWHERGLTFGEMMRVVAAWLGSAAKYEIRAERHGDTDTPGGLASEKEGEG